MTSEEISRHNIAALAELMLELWPECDYDEELQNCSEMIDSDKQTAILAKAQDEYIRFIQLSLRTDYVEGMTTSPIVYIEGLYVKPQYRKKGIAKALVESGKKWGRENGCREIASDAEIDNEESIEFHKRMGFEEVNRIVCFRKDME
jgi:aminoglycoside 6'-N-acetyltransferase I